MKRFFLGVGAGALAEYIIAAGFFSMTGIAWIQNHILWITLVAPTAIAFATTVYFFLSKKPYLFALGMLVGALLIFFGLGFWCIGC